VLEAATLYKALDAVVRRAAGRELGAALLLDAGIALVGMSVDIQAVRPAGARCAAAAARGRLVAAGILTACADAQAGARPKGAEVEGA
jgi:hypothetical protein